MPRRISEMSKRIRVEKLHCDGCDKTYPLHEFLMKKTYFFALRKNCRLCRNKISREQAYLRKCVQIRREQKQMCMKYARQKKSKLKRLVNPPQDKLIIYC